MWCEMCCAVKWKPANTCSADIPSLFSMLASHPSSNSLLTTAEFPLFAAYMRAVKPCSSVSSIPHCGKPLLPRTQSKTMRTSPAKAARCRLVYLAEQVSFTPRNICVGEMRRNGTWRNEKLASPEKNTGKLDGVGYFRKLIFLGTRATLLRVLFYRLFREFPSSSRYPGCAGGVNFVMRAEAAAAGGARGLHCTHCCTSTACCSAPRLQLPTIWGGGGLLF